MHGATKVGGIALRKDLQGLRAIAIIAVVLAHAGLTLTAGGFVGVDVFFVLSGYLITGLLIRELKKNSKINFTRFYARRLKRLLPALIFMLCVTCLLAIWLLSGVEARIQLASLPFAASWTSNFYFTFNSLGYFDEIAGRDLFLHTWSLGVEEQFYLIWPAILAFLFWAGKSFRAGKSDDFKLMPAGILCAFLASLVLSLYWTGKHPQAAFYIMPSRIWQLSLGAIVYLIYSGDFIKYKNLYVFEKISSRQKLFAGLVLILSSVTFLHSDIAYPGYWALLPSVGAALVIAAGHGLNDEHESFLSHPLLVWIGDRSYSLYLWHWPLLILGFSLGYEGQFLPPLLLLISSMLAAMLSYRFIEIPFWKGRMSSVEPVRALLVCMLVMSVAIFTQYHVLRQLPEANTSSDSSNLWRYDFPVIYAMGCDTWYKHSRLEPCVLGDEEAANTVVLFGDSIVAQWYSMVPEIYPEPNWRTIVMTKSACPIVDVDYFYVRIGKIFEVCKVWRDAALDELEKIEPDIIIIGSASSYEFGETEWVDGTTRILERLVNSATSIFLIPGTPTLGFDGPGCVFRNISSEGGFDFDACVSEGRLKAVEHVTEYLDKSAGRFSNVHLLDLNGLVCPERTCSAASKTGQVIYRDSKHLTDSFVRSKAPAIKELINAIH